MFKVVKEIDRDNFAKFALEPLESGFGHTLGVSLRRVLMTSLEGSAITSVKIDGVSHQFSTIPGVVEDVIEIILNIKKIRVKVHSKESVKLSLKATGKKEVKAKDLEVLGDGEIANPEQLIATLTDSKAKLNIDMVATQGRGYASADESKNEEIGVITLDGLYSPVVSANYFVESTRVGRRTDFDKLILEITTDGTITPTDALNQAANILSSAFTQIYEPSPVEEIEVTSKVSDETLKLTIDELDLPVRITNALRAIDVNSVEDLVNISRGQLLKAKNLGNKSLNIISEKLVERGLSLREA